MTRRCTIDTTAARDLVLAACEMAETDSPAEVLATLMFATAMVISELNSTPAGAVEAARTAGPALAELVEQVQALKLETVRPGGNA